MRVEPKIKNKFLYYGEIFNTMLSFMVLFGPYYSLNLYIETFSNEVNYNWNSSKKREEMLSNLTTSYFLEQFLVR